MLMSKLSADQKQRLEAKAHEAGTARSALKKAEGRKATGDDEKAAKAADVQTATAAVEAREGELKALRRELRKDVGLPESSESEGDDHGGAGGMKRAREDMVVKGPTAEKPHLTVCTCLPAAQGACSHY